ncbi:methionyl-tRNA formyltransferase [Atopostipes suicloacalis DSM 15692]|uniref:Methionyl-tRNA formyltransferase n=1 Tax=Atopostipes suicloacalis DSM 15692 TaxID=1121025 RepID=A0A1M4VVJ7_9LACT|nr:methionyl-tRNA formyltransferase [Atopostipes suicloacalis]SHE72915.1 methionyl-tRNA formyltransferase [Atopostipes suicloacalis DSM 15692]
MRKVIFMGTPSFSVPILQALIEEETIEIVAVVTQPDRKVGRKQILTPSPVKKLATEHEIPVLQPEKLSGSSEMQQIVEMEPDLLITAAYGQYVPTKLLNIPTYRAINVHASLLPKYRGAAPIHYAVLKGDDVTGVTIMYMEKVMDAGDIIAQREIPITKEDDTGTLFEKLSLLGRDLLMDTLPKIFARENASIKQDESKVSFSPMISKEQEKIDWEQTAKEIYNLIRALRPAPGAYTLIEETRFKVWDSEVINQGTSKDPGTIIKIDKEHLYVACGEQTVLSLKEVQPAGKKRMGIDDYLIGTDLELDDHFTV